MEKDRTSFWTSGKASIILWGALIASSLTIAFYIGWVQGGEAGRREASADVCQPPGVRAEPAAVEAFFAAWNDPAIRAGVSTESRAEVVLAEALRLVLYSEQGGFEGFNVYMSKSALFFTQEQIEDVGTKLATGKPEERLVAFQALVESDLAAAALVEAVLNDARIRTAPLPPPEPAPEPEEEPVAPLSPTP